MLIHLSYPCLDRPTAPVRIQSEERPSTRPSTSTNGVEFYQKRQQPKVAILFVQTSQYERFECFSGSRVFTRRLQHIGASSYIYVPNTPAYHEQLSKGKEGETCPATAPTPGTQHPLCRGGVCPRESVMGGADAVIAESNPPPPSPFTRLLLQVERRGHPTTCNAIEPAQHLPTAPPKEQATTMNTPPATPKTITF